MKIKIAAVGLAHPFEVGFDNAENLLNTTVRTLEKIQVNCFNSGVIMHDLLTVEKRRKNFAKKSLTRCLSV